MEDRIHRAAGGGHPSCSRCGGVDFVCVTCTGGGGGGGWGGGRGGGLDLTDDGDTRGSGAPAPSQRGSTPSTSRPGSSHQPTKKGFGEDAKIAPLPFTNVKRPKKSTLSLKDVLATLHDIFEKKITSDIANERTGSTKISFPDYLTDYFTQKYGLRKVFIFQFGQPPPYCHRIFDVRQPPHFHRSSRPSSSCSCQRPPMLRGLVRETS
jgi:hypothetical protein